MASVGASLRTLSYDGRDLVLPFGADELRPAYRGMTLAPWPNRIVDGRYAFRGAGLQLPLTEPARSHALHGLVGWLDFEVTDRGERPGGRWPPRSSRRPATRGGSRSRRPTPSTTEG